MPSTGVIDGYMDAFAVLHQGMAGCWGWQADSTLPTTSQPQALGVQKGLAQRADASEREKAGMALGEERQEGSVGVRAKQQPSRTGHMQGRVIGEPLEEAVETAHSQLVRQRKTHTSGIPTAIQKGRSSMRYIQGWPILVTTGNPTLGKGGP